MDTGQVLEENTNDRSCSRLFVEKLEKLDKGPSLPVWRNQRSGGCPDQSKTQQASWRASLGPAQARKSPFKTARKPRQRFYFGGAGLRTVSSILHPRNCWYALLTMWQLGPEHLQKGRNSYANWKRWSYSALFLSMIFIKSYQGDSYISSSIFY